MMVGGEGVSWRIVVVPSEGLRKQGNLGILVTGD